MVDPRIVVISEEERPSGLLFTARIMAGDAARQVRVHLHWADYNLWSPDGTDAPEQVARAALALACSRSGLQDLPDSFDLATLRRRHRDADQAIAELLRRGA